LPDGSGLDFLDRVEPDAPVLAMTAATAASVLLYGLSFERFAPLPIVIDVVLVWGVLARHWSVTTLA
jgi:hypothetical protein